jgi:hypothetical protein
VVLAEQDASNMATPTTTEPVNNRMATSPKNGAKREFLSGSGRNIAGLARTYGDLFRSVKRF